MVVVAEMFKGLLPVQIFVYMVSSLSCLVNGLVVGNTLPDIAMVAVGFIAPFTTVMAAISSVISGGARILCGRFMGKGDVKAVDRIFTLSVIIIVIVGLVITVIGMIFAPAAASLLGASGESLVPTTEYFRGMCIGTVFSLLVPCLLVFLQMGGDSGFALFTSALLAAVNAVCALFFIKVLNMDVFGAGLATSFSQFITAIAIFLRFKTKKGLMHFNVSLIEKSEIKDIVVLGFPAAAARIMYSVRNIVINTIALQTGGQIAVGALAVFMSFNGFIDAFNVGVSTTITMIASLAYGEKDADLIKKLCRYAVKIGLLIAAANMCILFIFGGFISSLFGASGETLKLSIDLIRYYSLSIPINVLFVAIINTYMALGRVKESNFIYIFACLVFPLAFILLTKSFIGITSVWLCYAAAEAMLLVFVFIYVKIKCGHTPKRITDCLMLEGIITSENVIKLKVRSYQDLASASKVVNDFCLKCGIDKRRSMLSGLFIEEAARNIVERRKICRLRFMFPAMTAL